MGALDCAGLRRGRIPDRPAEPRRAYHPLPFYFQQIHARDEYLLLLSGSGITRIGASGEVEWENPHVAVDGITIGDIRDGMIEGDAEMDPPGGWVPFRVDLATGRLLERGDPFPPGLLEVPAEPGRPRQG